VAEAFQRLRPEIEVRHLVVAKAASRPKRQLPQEVRQ
jgi:hypothetical protein